MWRPAFSFSIDRRPVGAALSTPGPVAQSHLRAARSFRDHPRVCASAEPVVYREEVLAILGALADLVVDVRRIRDTIAEDDGEAEAE